VSALQALTPLGPGIWAWLQPGGESGVSNAGVIADDDGLTVVDTLMVRSQWEPFAAAIAELGAPVRRVVLTHAHIDHVGGSKQFPLASVIASPATSALLEQAPMTAAYKAFMPAFADEFDELEAIGTRQATHEVVEPAHLTPRIEVLTASGHTNGDLLVLVDGDGDEPVLFAGDLCFFGVTPLAFAGDPAVWADALESLPSFAPTIVPGHGPVGGADDIRALQRYLRACAEAKGDVTSIPAGPWDTWLERDRDAINVERAALLADGNDAMPPSMLRAIGLA